MSYQFVPGKRFRWNQTNYRIAEVVSEGKKVNLKDTIIGTWKTVEVSVLRDAFFKGEIHFEIVGKGAKPASEGELCFHHKYLTLDDCPDHLAEIAKWRLSVIEPLVNVPGFRRNWESVQQRVEEVKAATQLEDGKQKRVSTRSVYRWIRYYEESQGNILALIPEWKGRCGGAGRSRVAERVDEIIKEKIEQVYCKKWVRTTIKDVHEAVAYQIREENLLLTDDENMRDVAK